MISRDEFSECVENINVLNLRLKNSDERCQRLRTDLRLAKQVCDVIGSPSPPPPPPPLLLSSLLRDSPIHDLRWGQQDPATSLAVSGRRTFIRLICACDKRSLILLCGEVLILKCGGKRLKLLSQAPFIVYIKGKDVRKQLL